VTLTKGEYALLLAFLDAPRRPLSREHLLQATRVHEDVFDRSIDVQILRLRRKLERDPSMPSIIQTERGVGDVFAVRSIVALFDNRISWSPPANSSNFPLRASNKPAERQYRGMGVRAQRSFTPYRGHYGTSLFDLAQCWAARSAY
jgi:DNA-binding winged helix-turn-helix (wHTH) protein